ncbi:MAG TPA: hypothetical protein VF389_10490 [Woeseiaceae bacterium]
MFALEAPIIARLQAEPALSGWAIRSSAAETTRKQLPAVEVQCEGAEVADARSTAVAVGVSWGVHLIAPYSPIAMESLDSAFAAVVASLHNYSPGAQGGRAWQRMQLQQVQREQADQGLVAYSLIFKTSARYDGQP